MKKSDLPFCVHFDETSTTQVKKQMDLTLRYWSPTHNEVWVNFYTSLFFGHAEGKKVADRIFQTMVKDDLPITKLCTLVRDGPNVNKTIFRKLKEQSKKTTQISKALLTWEVVSFITSIMLSGNMGRTLNSCVWTSTPISSIVQQDEKTITLYKLQWVWRWTTSKSIQR